MLFVSLIALLSPFMLLLLLHVWLSHLLTLVSGVVAIDVVVIVIVVVISDICPLLCWCWLVHT